MPRKPRTDVGGLIFHVLNRGNGRQRLFHKPADYEAFMDVLREAGERYPVACLGLCLMPNHWHLVLRPREDGALGAFMRWVGVTHVRRHHEHYRTRGGGHLYQGRYKDFIVQDDRHFLLLMRYVESNAVRAKLCERAEDWRWSSACGERSDGWPAMADWPVDRPRNWTATLNREIPEAEAERVRTSLAKGRPLGEAAWVEKLSKRLDLGHTLRGPGRPRQNQ